MADPITTQEDYSIFGHALRRLQDGASVDEVLVSIDAERKFGTVPLARRHELVGLAVAASAATERARQPYSAAELAAQLATPPPLPEAPLIGAGAAAYARQVAAYNRRIEETARELRSFSALMTGNVDLGAVYSVRVMGTARSSTGAIMHGHAVVVINGGATPEDLTISLNDAIQTGALAGWSDSNAFAVTPWEFRIDSIVPYENPEPTIDLR